MTVYDGNELTCPICVEEYRNGEQVLRLTCRHMCHTACWHAYMINENVTGNPARNRGTCVCCRGAGTVIAMWPFFEEGPLTQVVGGYSAPEAPLRLQATHRTQSGRLG